MENSRNFSVNNLLKKSTKFFMLNAFLILFTTSFIQKVNAGIKADVYKKMLGRGISTGWFKKTSAADRYNIQILYDLKARGFDNIRVRVAANGCNSSTELDLVKAVIEDCAAVGIVPVISWVNHDAEKRANNTDKNNYINFWGDIAAKVKNYDEVGYNLFTELSQDSPVRLDPSKYEAWSQGAINAIRAQNPQAMIILSAPGKKSQSLPEIPASLYQNDEYTMAEWHLYASGPNQNGGQKNWVGCGSASDKANVDEVMNAAADWTNATGIPTYLGAWMPWDNASGDLNQSETECFNEYFLNAMSDRGIPWTANAIQHVYDDNTFEWLATNTILRVNLDMQTIVDMWVSIGNFGCDELDCGGSGGTVPADPTNAVTTVISCSSVQLTWSDNSNDESSFQIKQSVNGGSFVEIANVSANTTSYTVTGLSENVNYTFEVKAENSAGLSGPATSNQITTPLCGSTVTTSLIPTDDTWVNSAKKRDNFGTASEMKLKNGTKEGLIKFDLSDIGTVTSAELKLTADFAGTIELWLVSDDSWDEGSVKWKNKPAYTSLMKTVTLNVGTKSIDITSFIANEADGDNVVSIALLEKNSDLILVDTKEGTQAPELVIDHDDVPKAAIGNELANVSLFPNPTNGMLNVIVDDTEFTYGTINIVNSYGSLLQSVEMYNKEQVINLENYNSGLYFITINYNGIIQTMPVIKK